MSINNTTWLFVANGIACRGRCATATPFGFVDGKAECLSAFLGSGWPEVTKCLTSLDGAYFRANGRRRLLRTLRIRFRPFRRSPLVQTSTRGLVFGNSFVVVADLLNSCSERPCRDSSRSNGDVVVSSRTASSAKTIDVLVLAPNTSLQCLRGCSAVGQDGQCGNAT